jgi:hypothetical protein
MRLFQKGSASALRQFLFQTDECIDPGVSASAGRSLNS